MSSTQETASPVPFNNAAPKVRPPRKRRRRAPGWVPDQHGAWAMLLAPLLIGVVASGGAWVHLPLAALWLVGYFAFFATGLWLKARCRPKYWPPVRTYALVSLPLGLVVLVLRPDLLIWVPLFVPLLGTSLVCSYLRKDRSHLNDIVAVVAGGLMLPVAYDAGLHGQAEGWASIWIATVLVTVYFLTTIPYVKTIIRERGNRAYYWGSGVAHVAAIAVPAVIAALTAGLTPGAESGLIRTFDPGVFMIFSGILAVRAMVVPRFTVTPKQTGIAEIGSTVVLAVLILVKVV